MDLDNVQASHMCTEKTMAWSGLSAPTFYDENVMSL